MAVTRSLSLRASAPVSMHTAPRWHQHNANCRCAQCGSCTPRTLCTSAKKDEADASTSTSASEGDTATEDEEVEQVDTVQLVAELDELKTALAAKEEEAGNIKDQLLRAIADNENTLTRMRREVDQARKFGVQKFAGDLLDVADNLSRAMDSVPEEFRTGAPDCDEGAKQLASLFVGVRMTESAIQKAFGSVNVVRIESMGAEVDPNLHDIKFTMVDADKESGTVGAVIREGYMLEERVLRAAEVGVIENP